MNVTLIDDHFISRAGIRHLLEENFENILTYESRHDAKFPEKPLMHHSDLVMIGLTEEDQTNLRTWEQITALRLNGPVIIYCSGIKYYQAIKFLNEGALGILFKSQAPVEFVQCVTDVLRGNRHICHDVLVMIADHVIGGKDRFNDNLTAREMLIAAQLKTGNSTSEIARTLKLTLSTISSSKSKIFRKLNVKNILELREIMNSGMVE